MNQAAYFQRLPIVLRSGPWPRLAQVASLRRIPLDFLQEPAHLTVESFTVQAKGLRGEVIAELDRAKGQLAKGLQRLGIQLVALKQPQPSG